MRDSFAVVAVSAAATLAIPAAIQERTDPIYDDGNHVVNSICPTPSSPPLTGLFPFANLLGSIVSPVLHGLIGDEAVAELE